VIVRLALLVSLFLVVSAGLARAGDEPDTVDGKAYFADGTAAFQRGDYAAASRAFAAGYEVEKWNGFLFAWAQSERVAGRCDKAIELYSRFIDTKPTEEAKGHALGWIKECGGEYLAPKLPPEPPKLPPEPPKPPPPPPPPPPSPGFQHKLALGFAAGAVASGIVAVRFYVRARHDFDVADREIDYATVSRIEHRGLDRLRIARVATGAGLALATAAVLRFVIHHPTRLEVSASGSGVAVNARF